MLKWILFLLLSYNLIALEISIDSAKDDFSKFSTLHISDDNKFLCQEMPDEFDSVREIICAFSKRPPKPIKNIQNDFFKIETFIKNDTFFISIKPVKKIKLFADIFDLRSDDSVYNTSATLLNRWFVIGYNDSLPLIHKDEKSEIGINFPFYLERDKLPYVGSLDIKGNPVNIKRVGDVKEYIKIKKYYEDKQYERCLDSIDDILLEYPSTLFKEELLYYKIKVYAQLKDNDNLVEYAKLYLHEYSSSENIAEVLSLVARAYSLIGLASESEYFFDRLFSEHANSVFTHWGYIYMAEMFESSGAQSKAVEFYTKALTQTEDMQVAATAAYRLANVYQSLNPKKSAEYIEKIVNATPSFFKENISSASKMMYTFADEYDYKTASSIAAAILDAIDPTYDEYEMYLKSKGLWLAKTEEKIEALEALNRYIKEFPDGDYISDVEIAKDALFFDTPESNVTQRLVEYEKLIELYNHDTIGNRAVYERAKLLLELKEYEKIIKTKEELLQLDAEIYPDKEKILTDAAIGLMERSLEEKECKSVLMISNEYKIALSNSWDDGIYECAMKGGDFQLAKQITEKNLKDKSVDLRKKWLYRYIAIDFAIGNYSEVIGAAKDLIVLLDSKNDLEYQGVYRYLFDAYNRTEQKEKLVEAIDKIEKVFGVSYKDIERYMTMVSIGSEKSDDTMVVKYATKVMSIQKSSSSTAQSPYVEFTLYQSYINLQNYNSALEVIESLSNIDLSKLERAREKYLLGSVLRKLWRDEEADVAFNAAIEADAKSPWAELAKSALNF